MRNFLVYKNAIIAIAFEISSFHSETQIGENKGRLKSLCSGKKKCPQLLMQWGQNVGGRMLLV